MFYFFLLIQKFHKLLKFFFIMHIRFSSIIKSCKTIIFQLPCDLFFLAYESTAMHWRWKMWQNLFMNLSSLFQQPSDSKNTYVDFIHFHFKYISQYFRIVINSLEPKKHSYNNDADRKMDPSLTSGAAVEREVESRKLQRPDAPSTWRHLPGDWLMFPACAGFINEML